MNGQSRVIDKLDVGIVAHPPGFAARIGNQPDEKVATTLHSIPLMAS